MLPIFTFLTVENINRQKQNNIRLLMEKGAVLIRSFEAGTRSGMMGMRGGAFRLNRLLLETARESDIVHLLVVDREGTVLAHNEPVNIDTRYGGELDLEEIIRINQLQWRIVKKADGADVFEVYRRFTPIRRLRDMHMGRMMFQRHRRPDLEFKADEDLQLIIFVGLDMAPITAAHRADIRHAVIMGVILLLIGFAGIILLFLAQSYRATKLSLSRVQAFSDNLVENMPIGLIALDKQKQIASINQVAGAILGISLMQALGRDAEGLLPRELLDLIGRSQAEKGVVDREINCRVGTNRTIPLEASASMLKDESGNFYGHVLLLRDLSEVYTLRKEIARNQRLATVGRLAAGVAHEIRNPLSSIKGFATYFKERYTAVPEDQHIAGIMIQEVDRLNRVVGQLLEFSRPVSLTRKPVSLKAFVKDSLKLVERQAQAKNIHIETAFALEQDSVRLDQDKMNQVLLNLYLNAIEAMDDKGGRLQVHVGSNPAKDHVELIITDNGTGIDAADLAHIFDPYFTTKSAGTGLGLAIVHKILEVHNGEIVVDSRPGEGTRVTITLPCATNPEGLES